ncbi:CDP-glycerol glycerophosphotransferase family protein [Vibrio sp. 10N.261.51.A3]|uniref:CDP-glycerol glycerophosphotransferase family protein n=1 Tax=Vibrio sp. 10N.261.51.A3 TaxID=3229673 RepID=UPI0035504F33
MRDMFYLLLFLLLNIIAFFIAKDNSLFLFFLLAIEAVFVFENKAIKYLWVKGYPIFVVVRTIYVMDDVGFMIAAAIETSIILFGLSNKYHVGNSTCYINGLSNFSDKLNHFVSLFTPYLRVLTPSLYAIYLYDLIIFSSLMVALSVLPFLVTIYYHHIFSSCSQDSETKRFILEYDPEVIMYVCGVKGGNYQLEQWISTLEKLNRRVLVVAREKFWLNSSTKTNLPFAYAKRMIDVEQLISSSTKVCLYPANGIKNAQMMRRTDIKHIFINHGESDKIVNTSRFLNAYDIWYLAGNMAKTRMEDAGFNVSEERCRLIGRPPLSIKLDNSLSLPNLVLYAPTWEGFDENACYSSIISHGKNLINQLISSGTQFIFKPHPLTGHVKREYREELSLLMGLVRTSENGTVEESADILDLMNLSSFLVTDISSVMNDYLQTNKPFFVTNPSSIPVDRFNNEFKTTKAAYIYQIDDDFIELFSKVSKDDYLYSQRAMIKEESLGPDTPDSFNRFCSSIDEEFDCNEN